LSVDGWGQIIDIYEKKLRTYQQNRLPMNYGYNSQESDPPASGKDSAVTVLGAPKQ
jgi:hypothetical protein